MTRRDQLVERACRRAELVHCETHESSALQHPERPVREAEAQAQAARVAKIHGQSTQFADAVVPYS